MIACLAIPYFAAAVERRHDEALQPKPLAIGGQSWEARPIYAFSQEVAHRGVEIGMSLRLVQVLSPESHFMPAAKTRYSSASGEVIDVLLDFSTLIEPQEWWHPLAQKTRQPVTAMARALPAHFCLDLEELPQREALPLAQEMGRAVRRETGLAPAIGLAAHKFTAQVAATVCRAERALPVEPGADAQFLAGRSLDFLALESSMAQRLRLLGIYTLGQLTDLPLAALREQFGPSIAPLYRLAQGEDEERVAAQPVDQREIVQLVFDGAVNDFQTLLAAADQLVKELTYRLRMAGLHGRELHLLLEMEDGALRRPHVILLRPTAETSHLATAVRELLANESLDGPVYSLQISIGDLSPAQARQLTLFDKKAVPPQAQRTLRNLLAKYRQSSFLRVQTVHADHPLLERRFQFYPLTYDAFVA